MYLNEKNKEKEIIIINSLYFVINNLNIFIIIKQNTGKTYRYIYLNYYYNFFSFLPLFKYIQLIITVKLLFIILIYIS